MLSVSLDCVVFLLCFSPSFLPYVVIFSGLCCVFALFPSVLSTLCCQFLWQRKWQHRVEKTERNKAKIQHNPEKLASQGRQDGEKQSKNTAQSRENGLSTLCWQFLSIVLYFCFVSLRLFYPMLSFSLDCVVFLLCFHGEKQSKNTTQSRETGNIGYTRRRKTKQKHNTIQRNWQHRVDKTEGNKAKTQHNPEKMTT
jgi:hypothetical protein